MLSFYANVCMTLYKEGYLASQVARRGLAWPGLAAGLARLEAHLLSPSDRPPCKAGTARPDVP